MKVQPIKFLKSLYYANKSSNMQPLKNHVEVVGELGDYAASRLSEYYPSIEQYAANHGLKIKLAQKGNKLLMSSGGRTTLLNMNAMERANEFQQAIYDNIKKGYNTVHIK